ncbi:hypothetical protein EJ04DRAFT_509746 [Polyplosphaeria fusca]|uniref:Uncharacterized protein n=1 Tax=Polyplosphaeria fusca TaxID=682080 RepID=A0A9P4R7T5_9PLEO|nr:hypothetical protein EJ04DRAFT_509746 [Polyplosphaeria fusca]
MNAINTVLLIILLGLVLYNVLDHHTFPSHNHPVHSSPAPEFTNCGNTPATARAAGCIFDPLGYLWVPPECYDPLTASEFREFLSKPDLQFGPFPFFRSNDTLDRISSEAELSERVGMKTYSTQQEHLAHCAFMLKRLERVREGQVRWDATGGWAHIEHCTHALVERLVEGENPLDRAALHTIILFNVVAEC